MADPRTCGCARRRRLHGGGKRCHFDADEPTVVTPHARTRAHGAVSARLLVAATTVFTVTDHMLFRPLPCGSRRLVTVGLTSAARNVNWAIGPKSSMRGATQVDT
jgi:hypothetical protein